MLTNAAGIPIKLHVSLLLILPLFTWIFGYNIQLLTESLGIDANELFLSTYFLGFLLGVGLFVSVAVHEIGHSLVALYRGRQKNTVG